MKKFVRFFALVSTFTALLALVTPAVWVRAADAPAADPENMQQLVAAVDKEGSSLNVAWSNAVYGGADGAKRIEAAINAKYHTHIAIKFLPLAIPGFSFTNQVAQEVAAGQTASSDVLFDAHLASEGAAMIPVDWHRYVPTVGESAMYYGHRAVGVATILEAFYYNTKLVPPNMVPKSLNDLLKPAWKGKIAAPPYEGAEASFITLPGGLGGDGTIKYFQAFTKQLGGVIRCGLTDRIASGEFWMFGYDCGDYEARIAQRKGQPIAEFYPKEGVGVQYYAPAIPKTSAHPMAARLFIAFLLTREGQDMLWDMMGIDNDKLPGSHMGGVMAGMRKSGVHFIEAFGIDAQHPELERYEKQIDDIVAQPH
jgi:ABC-type Fe3+ transport system substrate-binding protein